MARLTKSLADAIKDCKHFNRIKSTILKKDEGIPKEKRELQGIELHFCPPEVLASTLHGQDNEKQKQPRSGIDSLTVCYSWNQNAHAETPLHVACRHGNHEIVKSMIQFMPANVKSMMAETRSWKNFNGIHLYIWLFLKTMLNVQNI